MYQKTLVNVNRKLYFSTLQNKIKDFSCFQINRTINKYKKKNKLKLILTQKDENAKQIIKGDPFPENK